MDALPLIESLSNNTALRVEQEKYECDFEYALFVCIRDKMCSKGQYCEWIRIGQILKNELGDDGLDLFCEWSKLGDGKGLVDYTTFNHRKVCIKIYNALKQTKKKDNKPMLTKEHLKTIAKECNPEGYANRWGTETEEDLIDELTDVDIAKMFIEKYGNRFRCEVESRGQTRRYHYFNDNCLWEATYDHVLKNMLSNEFYIYLIRQTDVKLTEKCKKQVLKRLKTHTDKNHIAKEVTDLIFDAKFSKDVNNAEYLLPIKDKKIIDIRTNEVRDRTIEDKFDYECNATFLDSISKEQLDDIDKYFLELFCGNKDTKDLFIDTVKSCMIGRPLRYLFIVTGSGRNGKSLLFKIFRNIFVKSFDTLSKETIIQQKYGSQITTHLEKTRQCRAGYISETKTTDCLNEEVIKGITGGDPLDHRAMYMSNETLIAICCLWLLTNNLPQFMVAKAMIDRVVVFPMDNEFPVNVKFEEEMTLKYDAIFTYIMMNGNLYDEIKLTPEMEKKKQEYIEENDRDYLKRFISEKTVQKKDSNIIKISAFIEKYKTYCYSKNIRNKEEHWDVKRYIKELTGKYGLKIKESHDALKNLKLEDLDWGDEDVDEDVDEDDGCAEQK
jgi:phage/plasmid-associated DNA primase